MRVCLYLKTTVTKGDNKSEVELPHAKRQKLVAFMGSKPESSSADGLATSLKLPILSRSKQVMA